MSVASVTRRLVKTAVVSGALLASMAGTASAQAFFGTGGNVWVRYLGFDAANRSILAFTTGNYLTGTYTDMFINRNPNKSTIGAEFNIGVVAAGTEVVFRLTNTTTGNAFYSGTDPVAAIRNAPTGGFTQHIALFAGSGQLVNNGAGPGAYTQGFGYEDLISPPGDNDKNDLLYEIANFSSTSVVPEPSTYALMASGLLALGMASRRRRKV